MDGPWPRSPAGGLGLLFLRSDVGAPRDGCWISTGEACNLSPYEKPMINAMMFNMSNSDL